MDDQPSTSVFMILHTIIYNSPFCNGVFRVIFFEDYIHWRLFTSKSIILFHVRFHEMATYGKDQLCCFSALEYRRPLKL